MNDTPQDQGPQPALAKEPPAASAQLVGGLADGLAGDLPPDRLSVDPASPYFDAGLLRRGVAIRFKDRQRTDIEEYCISQKWVRVQAGKAVDRRGRPIAIRLNGPVEAWFEDLGEGAPVAR